MKNISVTILVFSCFIISDLSSQYNRQLDSSELVEFYNAMDGANWKNKWDFSISIDKWYGVSIDSSGCVDTLSLNNNNLSGQIPEIFELPKLLFLDLSSNKIVGTISDFNDLPLLEYIDLSSNLISGFIPKFSNLPRLTDLILSNNQFIGSVPDFKNLRRLIGLFLGSNQLSGEIPDFVNLPNLRILDLQDNQLSGPVPSFVNLTKLFRLDLDNNLLRGKVPEFNNSPELTFLYIHNNKLTGKVPDFRNASKLVYIDLENNQLSDSLPDFQNLTKLRTLRLNNNELIGKIPDFVGSSSLKTLLLHENQLSGPIPDFKYTPELSDLHLNNNKLSGEIPNFTNSQKLLKIDLANNRLIGTIPEFVNSLELENINLENNQLIGPIPDFSKLLNLKRLELAKNFLFGKIPIVSNSNLEYLNIENNKFTYQDIIPAVLTYGSKIDYNFQKEFTTDTFFEFNANKANLIDLKIDSLIMDSDYYWYKNDTLWPPPLGNNQHSNKLIFNNVSPFDFGRYQISIINPRAPKLVVLKSNTINVKVCDSVKDSSQLVLLFNFTNGANWINRTNWLIPGKPISEWFGITADKLGCVQSIKLDNNNLVGSLPILSLNTLDTLSLSGNNISGAFPEMKIPFIKQLNVRNNKLVGTFPNVLDEWMNLRSLDFGFNKLTGPIPPDLGDLCELIELRLDNNEIMYELPVELTNLLNLEIGKVDFNTNMIDSLKDQIIFFCPFGVEILKENPSYNRFLFLCGTQCNGSEWAMIDSVSWLADTLKFLPCIKDKSCRVLNSTAGYVKVRGLNLIYTKTTCCSDSTCMKKNVETRFFDCDGKKLLTIICTDGKTCLPGNYNSFYNYEELSYDKRWNCGDSLRSFTSVKNPNSKNKLNKKSGTLFCYPNPSTGHYVRCELDEGVQVDQLRLIDLAGRASKVLWSLNLNKLQIELPELESGIYLIELISSHGKQFFKLVIP